jgi:hypothetical protein
MVSLSNCSHFLLFVFVSLYSSSGLDLPFAARCSHQFWVATLLLYTLDFSLMHTAMSITNYLVLLDQTNERLHSSDVHRCPSV